MNPITKIITYAPALRAYMKGVTEFNSRSYENAVALLDKCMKHPSFNNELVYQHYGQALCALGQLNEGHSYLLKACNLYDASGWALLDRHELELAQETISTLREISENTGLEVSSELLNKTLKIGPAKRKEDPETRKEDSETQCLS